MAHHLAGKKILFIGTTYFQYNEYIVKKLVEKGAIVEYHNDDPFDRLSIKHLRHRFPPSLVTRINNVYCQRILKKTSGKLYDFLLLIRGEAINGSFMEAFTRLHPECTKLMYQWDSIRNHNYAALIPHFHKCYTFDRQDHEVVHIHYLPLFALEEFYAVRAKRSNTPQDIDILFVGYNHSSRIEMLRKLRTHFTGTDINIRSHIYTPRFSYLKNMLKGQPAYRNNEVSTHTMSRKMLLELLARTKIVVDMQSATQKGLTIRTFESLAAGCHLMTTNKEIQKEAFYDPRYITLLDLDNIKLPDIQKDLFIPFNQYALSAWLDNIFSI